MNQSIFKGLFHNVPDSYTFCICVYSLSCLQTIEQLNIVLDILNMYNTLLSGDKYVKFCCLPSHVGIQGNKRADKAAKAALNEIPSNMTIPFSDYKPYIRTYIRKKWRDFWDNQTENKLHSVQPGRNRREELFWFPVLGLDIPS